MLVQNFSQVIQSFANFASRWRFKNCIFNKSTDKLYYFNKLITKKKTKTVRSYLSYLWTRGTWQGNQNNVKTVSWNSKSKQLNVKHIYWRSSIKRYNKLNKIIYFILSWEPRWFSILSCFGKITSWNMIDVPYNGAELSMTNAPTSRAKGVGWTSGHGLWRKLLMMFVTRSI